MSWAAGTPAHAAPLTSAFESQVALVGTPLPAVVVPANCPLSSSTTTTTGSVTKTVTVGPGMIGNINIPAGDVGYDIFGTNTGANSTLSSPDTCIDDVLPAGESLATDVTKNIIGASWHDTKCTDTLTSGQHVIHCQAAQTVQPGKSFPDLILIAHIDSCVGGTHTNAVYFSGSNLTNQASFMIGYSCGVSVLSLAKTDNSSHVFTVGAAGQTFTLTVGNTGTIATSGTITVTDTMPTGITINATPSGTGWSCGGSTATTVNCTSTTVIAAGGSGNPITVPVSVGPTAATSATNTGSASGGGAGNTAMGSDMVTINRVVLGIAKAHTDPFTVGVNGVYTITVNNSSGTAPTSGTITVTDPLPAGFNFVSATGTGWVCNFAAGTVTCTSSTVIAAGGTGNPITLTVTPTAAAATSVVNSATASGGNNSAANPTANDPTNVNRVVLGITKTHTDPFTVGVNGVYTITVNNSSGTAPTSGTITVTDTLPTGLGFVSATGTGWACGFAAGTVTCTSSAVIAAGGTGNPITLTVTVGAAAQPQVTNSATASGGNNSAANPTANDLTHVTAPVLSIAKVHSGNFTVGVNGVYTITVGNTGTAATSGTITVTDPLPAGFNFVSATGTGWACGFAAGTVTCTSSSVIAAGGSGNPITLTVTPTAAAATSVVNSATASGGGAGNTPTANDPTTVNRVVLGITKTHTDPFTVGVNGVYTITVNNSSGTAPTSGTITVTDTLPTGLGFVSATGTGWACGFAAGTVTCTSSTVIAAGGTGNPITLTVTVGAAAQPQVTNSATASGGNNSAANPTANDLTHVTAPVLSITKMHSGNFTVGVNGVYTITVGNTGTAATSGTITVTDPLPAGFNFVSATGTGWACGFAAGTVTCTSSAVIAAGGSGNPITLTVTPTAAAATSVINSATASGGGAGNTPTANDPTTVNRVVLGITKTHSGNFMVGVPGVYTITVNNSSGTAPTSGTITVTDTLPTGLGFVSATGTGWACGFAAGTVTCTSSAVIAAGGTGNPITLTVTVGAAAEPSVVNSATASGGNNSAANPTANDPTNVTAPVLSIAKMHSGNFTVGVNGVYTITVGNTGTSVTTGTITVTDPLPAGFNFVSATGTGWICNFAAGTVTCTSSAVIAAGGSGNPITLTVTPTAAAATSVINSATASGGGASNTPTANDPTTVNRVVLGITKTHTDPFTVGVNGVYTITVNNSSGTAPTSGTITVTDTLPTGLGFVSATGTGWACGFAAGTVTCTSSTVIAAGASGNSITLTVTVGAAAKPSVINSATASGGNNSAANPTANDPTNVTQANLVVTKTDNSNHIFTVGASGQQFQINVSNNGTAATSGTITMTDNLPAGLTATNAIGASWVCNITNAGATVTCTTTTSIPASGGASPIFITVAVANTGTFTNTALASGGGAPNQASGSDVVTATQSNLTLTKTDNSNHTFTVGASGQTFTLTVGNNGTAPTSGTITVTDTMPAGITISATPTGTGWSCGTSTTTTVTCTSTTVIAAGGSGNPITVPVSVTTTGTKINTASASGGGASNTAMGEDTVTAVQANLTVTKTDNKGGTFTVGASGQTFTITVGNNGTAATSGTITVTDTMPTGITINATPSGTGWSCGTSTATTVNCTSTTVIAAGGSGNPITVSVSVSASAAASVTNTATASGGGASNSPTGSDTVTVNRVTLTVTKTHSPSQFTVGASNQTFTITVGNSGTAPTSGTITVTDPLPNGMSMTSFTGTGWSCSGPTTVTCTSSTVIAAGGAGNPITITVSVTNAAIGTDTNTATASGGGAPNSANGSTQVVVVGVPNLTITKTHEGNFLAGTNAAYTITVGNTGTAATSGTITVTDTLPTGLTFVSGTGSGWSCGAVGQLVTCTSTTPIAVNDTSVITLTVAVGANAGQTVTNHVCAEGGNAPNNPCADDTATVIIHALAVSKAADRPYATAGDRVLWTINFTNLTGGILVNGQVIDTLPNGIAYAPGTALVDGIHQEPTIIGRVLIWNIPIVTPGPHTVTFESVVLVGVSVNVTLVNDVVVRANPPKSSSTVSAEAQASIAIIAGPLTDRITITGRVILDNANHAWTGITQGVAGVRIYMEDGTSVLTDSDGRFTLPDVRPGMHVLRLDTTTLPHGVRAFDDRRYDSPFSTIRLVHGLIDTKLIQDVNFVVEGTP